MFPATLFFFRYFIPWIAIVLIRCMFKLVKYLSNENLIWPLAKIETIAGHVVLPSQAPTGRNFLENPYAPPASTSESKANRFLTQITDQAMDRNYQLLGDYEHLSLLQLGLVTTTQPVPRDKGMSRFFLTADRHDLLEVVVGKEGFPNRKQLILQSILTDGRSRRTETLYQKITADVSGLVETQYTTVNEFTTFVKMHRNWVDQSNAFVQPFGADPIEEMKAYRFGQADRLVAKKLFRYNEPTRISGRYTTVGALKAVYIEMKPPIMRRDASNYVRSKGLTRFMQYCGAALVLGFALIVLSGGMNSPIVIIPGVLMILAGLVGLLFGILLNARRRDRMVKFEKISQAG